jgi:hypothetical protein
MVLLESEEQKKETEKESLLHVVENKLILLMI